MSAIAMSRSKQQCAVSLSLCSYTIFFFFIIITEISSATPPPSVLRGVHPLDVKYFEAEVIKCKDGSNLFTKDRLNDDFCDCLDGTDEPGTSACPRGKFYCRNLGSQPRFLFSSRVNDHICDCCDGSDEFDGTTYCPNSCIMGGTIEYKTEYHQTTSAHTIQAKESKVNGTLEDKIRNLKGLKLLVFIQLIIVAVWALLLFSRRMKSSRRRHRL